MKEQPPYSGERRQRRDGNGEAGGPVDVASMTSVFQHMNGGNGSILSTQPSLLKVHTLNRHYD
jgi:hypothetical protein